MVGQATPPAEHPESTLRRTFSLLSSDRAQKVQLRLYALLLFVLGVLLAFNDTVFEFAARFTERPEILPITLLVPFVYMIFQVVLWRLERDEVSIEERLRFETRRASVQERCLEREAVVQAFARSMQGYPQYNMNRSTAIFSEAIAETEGAEHEIMLLSYSSETLLDGCLAAATLMRSRLDSGLSNSRRLHFRLLTRDPSHEWNIPCLTTLDVDRDYRRGLDARFAQFLSRWSVELPQAFSFLPAENVSLNVRWYPFEPLFKAMLLDDSMGLVAMYTIHEVNQKGVRGWDYHGHGARMYHLVARPEDESGAVLSELRTYFEQLWGRSRPADLN